MLLYDVRLIMQISSFSLWVGGLSKEELLAALRQAQVQMNAHAMELIQDERFETSAQPYQIEIALATPAGLGLAAGGNDAQLLDAAAGAGLHPCTLEVAPYLRLQTTEQAEDHGVDTRTERGAPRGSITVASLPPSDDEEFPRGLYLRRIDGQLWLRAYRSWPGHLWSPDDVFAFACQAPNCTIHP